MSAKRAGVRFSWAVGFVFAAILMAAPVTGQQDYPVLNPEIGGGGDGGGEGCYNCHAVIDSQGHLLRFECRRDGVNGRERYCEVRLNGCYHKSPSGRRILCNYV